MPIQTLLKDSFASSVAVPPEYQEVEKSALMKKGGVLKRVEVACEAQPSQTKPINLSANGKIN